MTDHSWTKAYILYIINAYTNTHLALCANTEHDLINETVRHLLKLHYGLYHEISIMSALGKQMWYMFYIDI